MSARSAALFLAAVGCSTDGWDSVGHARSYEGLWRIERATRIDYQLGSPVQERQVNFTATEPAFEFFVDTNGDGQQEVLYPVALTTDLAMLGPIGLSSEFTDDRLISYWFWDKHDVRLFFVNTDTINHVLTAVTLLERSDDTMSWLYVEDADDVITLREQIDLVR